MKPVIFLQLLPVLLLCGFLSSMLPAAELVPFTNITTAQAAELIKEKGADPLFKIIDVRTAEEFTANRIMGAGNIDFKAPDFKERIARLDKKGTYLAYCKNGVRSAKAMNLMKESGFKRVYNLGGGLKNWQAKKLPLEGAPL